MLKKFPSLHSFSSFDLQSITVLLLICDYLYELKPKVFFSLKACVGFSTFDAVSFLLKFMFLLNKKHVLLDFKTS